MKTTPTNNLSQTTRATFAEFRKLTRASLFLLAVVITLMATISAAYAAAPAAPQGVITAKGFLNIGGGTVVADLTGNAKFPDNPDVVYYYPYFEWNADPSGDINTAANNGYGDSYGAQMLGYFYPPSTGDYIFWISADDGANLYLSTDADPANKKLIAQESGWSNPRNWDTVGGGSTVAAKNSSTFTGTEWLAKDTVNGGAKITLTANKPYYIEALFKEGGGGDNLAVAVQDPNLTISAALPIPGQYLSAFGKNSGPATVATQPQSQTINEGQPVTFSVVADGTPPYTYQWRRNSTDITGATDASYTLNRAYRADNNAKFSVVITGAQGTVTSANATLTVNNDTTAPTLVSARANSLGSITVMFSEPVDPTTGQAAANYKLSGGVTVTAAALAAAAGTTGDNKVILTTSPQPENSTLTLTVNNVKDVPGNVIAANSTATVKTLIFASGVLHKFWENNSANNIAALTSDARFPDNPTFVTIEPRWEYGPNGSNESGSNYGNQLSGWFTPAQSGNYIFFTCSDDPSDLYLSTDDNPANKKLIAQETGWSNARNWVSVGGGSSLENKRSDMFASSEWDPPNVITLVAGKKYYMESLHTEGGGGDSVSATFIMEGETDPVDGDAPKIAGALVGIYLDPTGASVTISQAPQDTTQQEQRTVKFTVTATGTSAYGRTVTYQWQKALPGSSTFTDISSATRDSYETPLLTLADSGTKYRVICSVPTISEPSAAATLTVVPDTFAPAVTAAGAILKGTAIEIGVSFDENVDATTASAAANYTLSKGTVTGVRYQKYDHTDGSGFFVLSTAGPFNGSAVVLTTSGLAAGDTVTVTVKNVKDVKGNAISATGESAPLFVTRKMKWAAMGGDDFLQGETGGGQNITADPALWPDDVVAYSEADFDLISSGSANWSNYDEATFVYEEVTGDFDKVVRVEYQDPTSQWARAGMAATPKTDEGISRADVTGGYLMAQRYTVRANPAVQWNGSGGNNGNEAIWRDIEGGNYTGTGAGTPAYPNAWLRMQRSGQTFIGYYSSDGQNWTAYGNHTYTATDTTAEMPATLLVGIYYSPEFGNNRSGEGVGHSSVGKFRQYGSFVSNPSKVDFGIGLNFGADESDGSNSGTLPSISTAGVPDVIQANWNNLSLASGTKDNLVADVKGVPQPTTATVTWTCPNTWSSTGRGEENNLLPANDKMLMTGYLDTANATTTTVTISGLPSQLTAGGYDVYVYALGGVGGRGGGYRILNAADQAVLKDYVNAQSPTNPTSYVQAIPQAGAWAVGNYLLFTGLNAPAIIVEGTTEGGHAFGGTPRGPINAVQLVKAGAVVVPPSLKAELNAAGKVVLTFDGTLEAADEVGGTYSAVAGSSPLTVDPTAARKFYRAKR